MSFARRNFVVVSCWISSLAVIPGALAAPSGSSSQTTSSWVNQPSWVGNDPEPAVVAPQARSVQRARSDLRKLSSPFAPGTSNVSLDVGQVFLMGNVGSGYTDAIGGRLNYTYSVSDMFAFSGAIGTGSHAGKPDVNPGARYSMTYLSTGVRANLAWFDKVIPFAVAGLGFYRPSFRFAGDSDATAPILFGLNLGPGVSLELTRELFFGASLTFHNTFGATRLSSRGPLEVGGTFSTFFLSAGYTF